MTWIIGIDPGPEETAYAVIDEDYGILAANKVSNESMAGWLKNCPYALGKSELAVESIQSYGMPVGRTVFETAYMIGRIQQIAEDSGCNCTLYPRPEYAKSICGVGKINDSVIRQSLLLRFGGDKKGEPLYLLKGNSDKRSAFAVAAYHLDRRV